MTAHIIGGCPIGATAADGVIDPWQRLYGYDGLHVVDGAAVTAALEGAPRPTGPAESGGPLREPQYQARATPER